MTESVVEETPSKPIEESSSTAMPSIMKPPSVSCNELPREPSEREASLLVEPGAFSGDDFDEDAALAAVIAQDPQTDRQWVDAIVGQVQGDYFEAMCDAIRFSTEIGGPEQRPTGTQAPDGGSAGQHHYALVLDASGSMAAKTGSGTRIDAARTAMTKFVTQLPLQSTISLRVYGQEGGNSDEEKTVSCDSSEVLFEGVVGDSSFEDVIATVQPVGWTPLARAIFLVSEDIPVDAATAVVYVVTDGKETCGGDPVEAARQLADNGIEPIINVVGFEVGDAEQSALLAIAEAGNGQYVTASSVRDFNAFWDEEYQRLNEAWADWATSEKQRVAVQKEKLNLEVERITTILSTTAVTDLSRVQSLARRLGERGFLDENARLAVQNDVKWYFTDVKTYAWNFGFDSNREIASNSFDATFGATNESYDAWREAYEHRLDEDG